MAKIRVASPDMFKPGRPAEGETADGAVVTRAAIDGDAAPLHARFHDLAPAARIAWSGEAHGFLAYVWSGAVVSAGARLEAGSVIVVEPNGTTAATALEDGASLLVFNPASGHTPSSRPGGHVHRLPADRVPRTARLNDRANVGAAIFADSACPTCELWLHESAFNDGDFDVALHSHSEDEIIVVTAGEIVLGRRRYGRGTAISVAKEAIYGFRTGPTGLTFINFRPCHPTYRTADGERFIDEQAFYREPLGRPPYLAESSEIAIS